MSLQALVSLLVIMIFLTVGVMKFMSYKKKYDNNEITKDELTNEILGVLRTDFINMLKTSAPIILKKDTVEGRESAYVYISKLFFEFVETSEVFTESEKELLKMIDVVRLLYIIEDKLIEFNILQDVPTSNEVLTQSSIHKVIYDESNLIK